MSVRPELENLSWRKSSFSGGAENCVEVAAVRGGCWVRDTKDRAAGAQRFSESGWSAFVGAIKDGQFG